MDANLAWEILCAAEAEAELALSVLDFLSAEEAVLLILGSDEALAALAGAGAAEVLGALDANFALEILCAAEAEAELALSALDFLSAVEAVLTTCWLVSRLRFYAVSARGCCFTALLSWVR